MSASSHKEPKKIFGMSLGAEPKQLAALGGLLLILAIVWFVTRDSGGSPGPSQQSASTTRVPPDLKSVPSAATRRDLPGGPKRLGSRQTLSAGVKEFRPSLKPDKDNPIDPSRTDPTIHLASLIKIQGVPLAGGGRSLFDFGSMPSAEAAKTATAVVKPKNVFVAYGPPKPEPMPPPPPVPPPPAIPLKFYGFVHSARLNDRRAFFMENEEIFIASEGEMIKKRYKLVRIGVNSADLEDTQYKNNKQTIKLAEEAQSTNP